MTIELLTFDEAVDKNNCTILTLGMGVNSTAIIAKLINTEFKPDLLIFADTGGSGRKLISIFHIFRISYSNADGHPSR